jgi:diadenosine tetraphosphate (Ap4A) HIT family hydrolase
MTQCELCHAQGEVMLWQNESCRVILVMDNDYLGFCRVIWQQHIKEMTDLKTDEQQKIMYVVFAVEQAVREVMQPDKINLASLGNVTPHLHWHVIPRYTDDRHFPNPVWGKPLREFVLPASAECIPTDWQTRLGTRIKQILKGL